jgi:predicted phage terminase large subunit-like protein
LVRHFAPPVEETRPFVDLSKPWHQNTRSPQEEILEVVELAAATNDLEALKTLQKQLDAELARASFPEFFRQAWRVVEPNTELVWNWHLALICVVVQAVFFDWLKAKKDRSYLNKVRNIVFNVPPGSSKPVHVDGLVLEKTRGLIRAGDVNVGDQLVTHRGRHRRVLAVHEQGVLPLYKFTTQRGRAIEVAGDHAMLTQRGWVRADEVTTRDVFAEVHAIQSSGTSTISSEESRLLGYLIGDGCITEKATASFTNQDPLAVADFQYCADQTALATTITERPPSLRKKPTWGTHVVYLKSRERGASDVRRWLTKHDLVGKNSHTKRVPSAVMAGDFEVVAEYLAAYWSCDGGIHDRRDIPRAGRPGQTTNSVRIDATTVSEGLARDHQALLQRLGLSFSLRRKTTRLTKAMVGADGKRIGEEYVSWQLVASDQDTAAKFMQVIGPRMRHEKRTRAAGLQRTNFDRVLSPDSVLSVERVRDGECRCFTIEEDESFVYQGVAVHNSRILAVCFQAWAWLHCPGMKFICLSVNDDATMRDARATRDLIRSPWYVESFGIEWSIKTDQDAISNYGNTAGGERISMASKSEIVGLRADVILIDDANNPKKSESKNERDEINELWSSNQYNRVNDGMRSLRIGVQQRTHAADWTGNVVSLQGTWAYDNRDGWLHVVIPAEFEEARRFVLPEVLAQLLRDAGLPQDDLVLADPRTKEGDSIDPVRMPTEYLASERKRWAGTGNYAGQMQQSPVATEGNKVNRAWWNFFRLASGVRPDIDELESGRPRPAMCHAGEAKVVHGKHYGPGEWDFDWITISIDCASKKTEKGSNYGILVIGGKGGRRYVLDDATQRGSLHEIIAILVGTDDDPEHPRSSGLVQKWRPDSILIEPKAAGPDVMDTLIEQMGKGDVPMVAIWEAEPGNQDKEMRLEAAIPYIKNGMVHLLDGAPWLEEFVKELSLFPNGLRDDRVDALSQCLNHRREADDEWPDM